MNKSDKAANKILSLARNRKLHPTVQSILKEAFSKEFRHGMALKELSMKSYNYDFYAIIDAVVIHIEIIFSLSVVDRDINMLKSSDADLKIALIKDEILDGGAVRKKYLREMESRDIPLGDFTTFPLSIMFSEEGISDFISFLRKRIDEKSTIKGTIKHYEEIKEVLTEIGKSKEVDAIFELINNNLLSKDVFGVSGFSQNLNKINAEIQNIAQDMENISSEKLCKVNFIIRKYRISKFHNKLLNLNLDSSIDIKTLIEFFKDKECKNEAIKDTEFGQLFDLKRILDAISVFSESDLILLSKYKDFSSGIFNRYSQRISQEPFVWLKHFGSRALTDNSWGDKYGYENIVRVLYFYKIVLEYRELLLNDMLPELTYSSGNYLRQNAHYVVGKNKYYDTKTRVFASSGSNVKDFSNLKDNKVYMWNLGNPKIPEIIFSGSELSLHKILVKTIEGTDYLIAASEDNCIYAWDLKFPQHPVRMFTTEEENHVELIDAIDLNKNPAVIGTSGDTIFYWDFFGKANPIREQLMNEHAYSIYNLKMINNELLYCSKVNFDLTFGDLSGKTKTIELAKTVSDVFWLGVNAVKLEQHNGKILILLAGQFRRVYIVDTDEMDFVDTVFEQKNEGTIITDVLLKTLNGISCLIASTLEHKILIWDFDKGEKYPAEIDCGEDDLYEVSSQKINGRDYLFTRGLDSIVYMIDPLEKRVIEKFEGAKGDINSVAIEKINL